jgi:hypothetical protein
VRSTRSGVRVPRSPGYALPFLQAGPGSRQRPQGSPAVAGLGPNDVPVCYRLVVRDGHCNMATLPRLLDRHADGLRDAVRAQFEG